MMKGVVGFLMGVRFALLDSAEMTRQLIDQYAEVKQRQAL